MSAELVGRAAADPFYAAAADRWPDDAALLHAGFFDVGVTTAKAPAAGLDRFATPTQKLHERALALLPGPDPVVLITTGGFSPPHPGHLEILEVARKELEAHGSTVLGGYLSPSHDSYVSTKRGGAAAWNAEARIAACAAAVADSDWLMVDPWEARYVGTAINFTDVITHTADVVKAQFDVPVDVVYVFGSDNAGFARAFLELGRCVCVERPGFSAGTDLEAAIAANAADRVLFVSDRANPSLELSSTSVRDAGWVDHPQKLSGRYLVRNDLRWAAEPWATKVDAATLEAATDRFTDELVEALREALDASVTVETLDVEDQADAVRALAGPYVNLDVVTADLAGSPVRFDASRAFSISDGQVRGRHLVPRPGFAPLDTQRSSIAAGAYTVVDDDIATGTTIAAVTDLLGPEVVMVDAVALTGPGAIVDVVDARDFLLGGRHSGLVVEMGSDVVRVPYLLPYVSTETRARLRPAKTYAFSVRLWEANRAFFAELSPALTVADASDCVTPVLAAGGFAPSDLLSDVCTEHVRWLTELGFEPVDVT